MDQSGRLLLEGEECDFPVLGVWAQCESIRSMHTYEIVSRFLHSQNYKLKIYMTNKQKNCIYFVNIIEGEMPECFLVSWE